jgi:hypothetical protein
MSYEAAPPARPSGHGQSHLGKREILELPTEGSRWLNRFIRHLLTKNSRLLLSPRLVFFFFVAVVQHVCVLEHVAERQAFPQTNLTQTRKYSQNHLIDSHQHYRGCLTMQ